MAKDEKVRILGVVFSLSKWKEIANKCIEGKVFERAKFVKKHNLQKYARSMDKYWGWFSRKIWSLFLPVDERKIVFLSFNKQYTCNPKYICREIIKRGLDYDLVWLTTDDNTVQGCAFPACVRRVKIGSARAFREMMTAKIIVENAYLSQELGFAPKKKGQYHIQTWHGSLGIKRFGPQNDSVKSRVSAAIRAGKFNDMFLSNSTFETQEVVPVFWKSSEVCEWGHARNDIILRHDAKTISEIRSRLLLPDGVRTVLYAPTFRDSKTMDHYELDYDGVISALQKRFGGDWVVLVKFHYSNRKTSHQLPSRDKVINVSGYADIQELMVVADVGITDYSSWIFDYMLMARPAFLFAEDIADYKNERGFYYPLDTTPFPLSETNRELCEKIMEFDLEKYQKEVETFLKQKGCVEDGHAAQRAVDRIEKIISG